MSKKFLIILKVFLRESSLHKTKKCVGIQNCKLLTFPKTRLGVQIKIWLSINSTVDNEMKWLMN